MEGAAADGDDEGGETEAAADGGLPASSVALVVSADRRSLATLGSSEGASTAQDRDGAERAEHDAREVENPGASEEAVQMPTHAEAMMASRERSNSCPQHVEEVRVVAAARERSRSSQDEFFDVMSSTGAQTAVWQDDAMLPRRQDDATSACSSGLQTPRCRDDAASSSGRRTPSGQDEFVAAPVVVEDRDRGKRSQHQHQQQHQQRQPSAPPPTPTSRCGTGDSANFDSVTPRSSCCGGGFDASSPPSLEPVMLPLSAAAALNVNTTPIVDQPPQSPVVGVWLAEPPSIDEPLLMLDESDAEGERTTFTTRLVTMRGELSEATAACLDMRSELSEARASFKADQAALEALTSSKEILKEECDGLRFVRERLDRENGMLRLQLQDHHGIMAADWAQTLVFEERLKSEEESSTRLAREVADLREGLEAKTEEAAALCNDATRWRTLCGIDSSDRLNDDELDGMLQVTLAASTRFHGEITARNRSTKQQLSSELEQQLCVVCRDEKKAVLLLPCLHVCICEKCRLQLKVYKCPMCQEPIQSHYGRVHF